MIGSSKIGLRPIRGGGGGAAPNPDFVSTWDTTQAGSASDTIVLPMTAGNTVHWGDGNSDTTNTHTYASSGAYTVTIEGAVTTFRFNNSGDRRKIVDISNWGGFDVSNSQIFRGCTNLDISATDYPIISTTNLSYTFLNCSSLTTPNFSNWDTSSVTNFTGCFQSCSNFNSPLDGWVHSGVTALSTMMSGCATFNQDLDTWDVSGATSASTFMRYCTSFNGNTTGWVLKGNWTTAFRNTNSFVGIGANTWDTSGVTNMSYMFANNSPFDQNISSWDINQVSNFTGFVQSSTGLSTANYDALLIAWDAQGAMAFSGTVNFGGSQYTSGGAAETARTSLISKWGGITDGGAA